jgi:dolichol-phosphate mannosyltransferase
MMLSVVLPAYNEASVIEATIRALAAELDRAQVTYELLVVNDKSRDATADVLTRLEAEFPTLRHVDNPGPHGYGRAVRHGLAHYRGDAVVIAMADGSDAPSDVLAYWRLIEAGQDCAFGMRFAPGTKVEGYPPFKRLLNRAGNRLIAGLLGSDYTDFTNGFKCFRRHVIDGMQPLVGAGFNLTIEMSMKAVLSGARFAVVPNSWVQRVDGVSKFRLVEAGALYLATIAYCLLQHRLARGGIRR